MKLRGDKLQGKAHPDIKADSAAYNYEIPDDDTFYLMASSGVNPESADLADDVSTNWIGALLLSCLHAHGATIAICPISEIVRQTDACCLRYLVLLDHKHDL